MNTTIYDDTIGTGYKHWVITDHDINKSAYISLLSIKKNTVHCNKEWFQGFLILSKGLPIKIFKTFERNNCISISLQQNYRTPIPTALFTSFSWFWILLFVILSGVKNSRQKHINFVQNAECFPLIWYDLVKVNKKALNWYNDI